MIQLAHGDGWAGLREIWLVTADSVVQSLLKMSRTVRMIAFCSRTGGSSRVSNEVFSRVSIKTDLFRRLKIVQISWPVWRVCVSSN